MFKKFIYTIFVWIIFFCGYSLVGINADSANAGISENNMNTGSDDFFIDMPVNGKIVKSFSASSKYGKGIRSVKIAVESSEVKAGVEGKVINIGKVNKNKYVTILSGNYKLSYSPLKEIFVKKGDQVNKNSLIGTVDKTQLFSFSLRQKILGEKALREKVLREKTLDENEVIGVDNEKEEPQKYSWEYINPENFFANNESQNSLDSNNKSSSSYYYVGKIKRNFSLNFFKKLLIWQIMKLKPDSFEVLFRLVAIYDNLSNCSTNVVNKTSKNILVLVSGINTFASNNHKPVEFDFKKLGYSKSDKYYFSYGKNAFNEEFKISDTYGSTKDFAKNLFSQFNAIEKIQKLNNDVKIDIVAHSQGGVVVKEFLKNYYYGSSLEGKIEHVVNFSSPQEGTPFASLRFKSSIKNVLDDVPVGFLDSEALSEMTEFNSYMSSQKMPSEIKYLSIGSNFDFIVPATNVSVDSDFSKEISVNSGILNAHSEIKNDKFALKSANAFLTDQKMPCLSAIDAGSSLIFPTIIKAIY